MPVVRFRASYTYFCEADARTDGEAEMSRIEPGDMWERVDGPVMTVQIVETDWLDENGESYVRFECTDGTRSVSMERFRQEFRPMRLPPRKAQTVYDRLIEDDLLPPPPAPSEQVVSSVTVEVVGGHDVVRVWNRGGLAGTLTVCKGDGEAMKRRLLGGA
jgi:hypothetical protein